GGATPRRSRTAPSRRPTRWSPPARSSAPPISTCSTWRCGSIARRAFHEGDDMSEVAIAAFSEFKDGDHRVFAVDELEVGIFRLGDKIVAYGNLCPPAGGPGCPGKIFPPGGEPPTPRQQNARLRPFKRP